jgi:putative DNA primase/helicase
MRQDFFTFPPTHKLVLSTNHKPQIRGTDHGIRRRIRLIPFCMKFWRDADRELAPEGVYDPEFRADPGLEERLSTTEAAGILADMVEHARAFYEAGSRLNPPAEVNAATVEYLKAEDILGQFFEMMVKPDPDGSVTALGFYHSFKKWAVEEGLDEKLLPSVTRFGREAKKRYSNNRAKGGIFYHVRLMNL